MIHKMEEKIIYSQNVQNGMGHDKLANMTLMKNQFFLSRYN